MVLIRTKYLLNYSIYIFVCMYLFNFIELLEDVFLLV